MPSLAAHTDLAGLFPSYYNPNALAQGFVGAPEQATTNPQIDAVTAAAAIMWPGLNPLVSEYSYFQGVRRLAPGTSAAILDDRLVVQSEYANISEDRKTSLDDAHNDAAIQIGTALERSIAQLITDVPDSISADFSGGLDSTTLALAAATRSPRGNTVLGLVQHNNEYPAGDIPYALRFARLSAKLVLRVLVTGENELPFNSSPPADLSPSEPYRGTAIFGREQQRLLQARPHHITGTGGDALFDPEPTPVLVELLLSGHQELAKGIAIHIGRATLQNPVDILQRTHLKAQSNLTQSLERTARQLTSNDLGQASQDWLPSLGSAATWLTPAMREAVAARASEIAKRTLAMGFDAYVTRQTFADSGDAYRHLRMLAERCGVALSAPYLGEAALRPVLTLPIALRIRPGHFKPLLYAASQAVGLAPEEIFTRKGKGAYSGEMRAGFERALPEIRVLLGNSLLARLGVIDAEAVLASLSQRRVPFASLIQLIATERWLNHLGVDGVGAQPRANSSPAETGRHAAVRLPEGYFSFIPQLHIVPGPHGQIAGFDPERGVFLPPIGRSNTTRLILRSLADNGNPQAAVASLCEGYPDVPLERITADVASTVRGLAEHGWLQVVDASEVLPRPLPESIAIRLPPAEAGEVLRVRDSTLSFEEVTAEERNAAAQAYTSMLQLTRDNVLFTDLTRYLIEGNGRAIRPASPDEVLRALEIARLVTAGEAQHRVACYELSLTAALCCISRGLSVDWCLGISFDSDTPAYHAWLEANGSPVRGRADEVIDGIYQRVLRVSSVVAQ